MEGGIGERKMKGIGDDGAAQAFLAGPLEHRLAEIGAGDLDARGSALDGEGEIAAAGGQIKERRGIPPGDDGGGSGAPEKVEAAGEEMIGQIVSPRDGREEAVDELGLLQMEGNLLARPDEANQKDQANRGKDGKGDEKALKER
jgi:hypothetical protein